MMHFMQGRHMSGTAAQITVNSTVRWIVCKGQQHNIHQSIAFLALGNPPMTDVDSPDKGPVMRKEFLYHDVVMGFDNDLGPILLTWFNFNLSMDK